MLTITAVIRSPNGPQDTMRRACAEGRESPPHEPDTIGASFHRRREPHVFTTMRRFRAQAAQDAQQ